jgi:hypothetical protein
LLAFLDDDRARLDRLHPPSTCRRFTRSDDATACVAAWQDKCCEKHDDRELTDLQAPFVAR